MSPAPSGRHRLDGEHYVEETVARAGELLTLTEPVDTTLDPATLNA